MRKIPIHPIIFALGPIISLYLANAQAVLFSEVLRPLAVTLAFAVLLWLATDLITKDYKKSSVIVSIFFLLFFSYFHTVTAFVVLTGELGISVANNPDSSGSPLSLLWLGIFTAVFVAAFYVTSRAKGDIQRAQDILNILAFSLAAVLLVTWFLTHIRSEEARAYVDSWHREMDTQRQANNARPTSDSLPDIYYIILDGYARADILEDVYQVDNSEFLSYLAEKGFYIADQSHSNYAQTASSLASSLNFMYLDRVADQVGHETKNRLPLLAMLEDSIVAQILKEHGYTILSFSTGYSLTEIKSADTRQSPSGSIGQFENLVVRTTPIPILLELPFLKTQYDLHRERILFTFDHLPDATAINSSTFVFAHIIAPHPPFVFGPNGEHISPNARLDIRGGFDFGDGTEYATLGGRREYVQGYKDQLHFTTARLWEAIEEILLRSPEPPIIILQADHGPGSRLDWQSAQDTYLPERMSIFNAYYFPDKNYDDLYPEITPVNTFRVVLNLYFARDYELLDDRSFFSTTSHPFSFLDVTQEISPNSRQ